MRTISEDRRAIAKAIMLELQCHDFGTRLDSGDFRCSSAQIDLLEACCNAAADRVIALRAPPSGEAGEVYPGPFDVPAEEGVPVRWRVSCSNIGDEWFNDEASADQWANSWGHYDSIVTPYVLVPQAISAALPTIKEPTDGQ